MIMTKKGIIATLIPLFLVALGCSKVEKEIERLEPELLSEKGLSEYREKGEGGFSHSFVAYVRQSEDETEYYVDVNGSTLGPFDRVSRKFFFNSDGSHMVFAARSEGYWWVIVDGEKRWRHDALGFFWQAWTANLERTIVVPQTQAVAFALSADGDQVSYLVSQHEKWAIATNGVVGEFFEGVSVPEYFDGQLRYVADESRGKFVISGDQKLGPFSSISGDQFSDDGDHVAFTALKSEEQVMYIDDIEQSDIVGFSDFVIGPDGKVVIVVEKDGGSFVRSRSGDLNMGPYDEVARTRFDRTGANFAFYARTGNEWKVVTSDGVEYPAGDGYYVIRSGDRDYSLMWSIDSNHVVYFVRKQSVSGLMVDGQEVEEPTIPGFSMRVLYNNGEQVGVGLMNGPHIDRYAFASVVANDITACDPVSARTVAGSVSCIQDSPGIGESILIGEQLQGPYDDIRSVVMSNQDDSHYAYIVSNGDTETIVLDGIVMPEKYDKIYVPEFVNIDELAFLALRNHRLLQVRYGL